MQIKPLRKDVEVSIRKYGLRRRWNRAKQLFEVNIRQPSLHTELLEPHWRGKAEVFKITKHYKK